MVLQKNQTLATCCSRGQIPEKFKFRARLSSSGPCLLRAGCIDGVKNLRAGCVRCRSAGNLGDKEFELAGKTPANFVPRRFRHGSVMLVRIFRRALISALLSFTPLLGHHYGARFLCIAIGNKCIYCAFFDLGMFVTLVIIRGKKGGLLGIIALFVLYLRSIDTCSSVLR